MAEEEQNLNNTEEETKDETKQEESRDTTEESLTEESEAKKSPNKSPAKTPVKAVKAKPKVQKKESSDEEDESDEEELVGSLDAPLVIEGKRDRKSTDFLVSPAPQSADKKKLEIPEGKGDTLGSMARVERQLSRVVADELKPLHRLLFGKPGTKHEVKKNIRCFNGFDIEKDSQEYKKKEEQVDRFTFDSLKRLCEILDISRKGKKDEMVARVMDFLMKPKATENPDRETPKTSSAKKKSGTKRKRPSKEGKTRSSKKKVEDKAVSDDEEEEEEDEEDEVEEKEEKKKESPRKKTKSPEKKKETKAKTDSKKSSKKDKKVVSIKISPGKKAKKGKAKDDSDSSDDEPLAKKTKKSPPTDDEIADLVKDLLDGADLEKVTMKSVCRQVYDRFPEFDLSDRKEFIKDTVKEIIT